MKAKRSLREARLTLALRVARTAIRAAAVRATACVPLAIVAALAPAFTGCIDLADPNIPNLGASAIFSATVRHIPGLPLDLSVSLTPGRDSSGVRRRVISPLIALGRDITLTTPNEQGTYVVSQQFPDSANNVGPFEIQPPIIQDLPQPPVYRWFGVKRLDTDTLSVDSMGDVTLHVQTEFGAAVTPANRSQQWFLELSGDTRSIHVSGDGPPPNVLRIPSQFIPLSAAKRVNVTLIYFQSATLVPAPSGYITSVTLDSRTQWIVKLR